MLKLMMISFLKILIIQVLIILEILRWCSRAKISKSISFRNAIWTHGYLLLAGGADLGFLVYELGYDWLQDIDLFNDNFFSFIMLPPFQKYGGSPWPAQ